MKKLLLLITSMLFTFTLSCEVFACTAPKVSAINQDLRYVLDSKEFNDVLDSYVGEAKVDSIDLKDGIKVNLSNRCDITATVIYVQSRSTGMCPLRAGVEVDTFCPQKLISDELY